eukprot:14036819-Alexandrium_andersonii.AAC.1
MAKRNGGDATHKQTNTNRTICDIAHALVPAPVCQQICNHARAQSHETVMRAQGEHTCRLPKRPHASTRKLSAGKHKRKRADTHMQASARLCEAE